MQVGLKTQYQGSQGQITFFLGNKHGAPLERLIFAVPPQPQFDLQLAPVPPRIDPKQQLQVSCLISQLSEQLMTFSGLQWQANHIHKQAWSHQMSVHVCTSCFHASC